MMRKKVADYLQYFLALIGKDFDENNDNLFGLRQLNLLEKGESAQCLQYELVLWILNKTVMKKRHKDKHLVVVKFVR